MRIVMPLDEEKDVLCPVFGRTPYFGVYDIEPGEKKVEENPAAQAQGGAGLQAAQFVLDCEADVLITARCGKNSAEVLQAGEVQIYKAEGTNVQQNLTAWKEGKLAILEHFHGGYEGIQ